MVKNNRKFVSQKLILLMIIASLIFSFIPVSAFHFGSEYVFNSTDTDYSSVGNLDSTHFVVSFEDDGSSNHGICRIGTMSGDTISYGPEYAFNPASTTYSSLSVLDSTHFVVAYMDTGSGTAIIGTVSGDTISYGAEYVFNGGATSEIFVSAFDSTHFVISYSDAGSNGAAIVGTVSGTTISYGSEVIFNTGWTPTTAIFALDSTHCVVGYCDFLPFEYGVCKIGVRSGNSITFGSAYTFNSAGTGHIAVTSLDSTHFVVAYSGAGSKVGVVSGTAISYGALNTFDSVGASYISISPFNSTHFVVVYRSSNNLYGTCVIGNVSGSAITYDPTKYVYNAGDSRYNSVSTFDSTNFVVAFQDDSNFEYGTCVIGSLTESHDYPYIYVDDDADPGWYDATHVATIAEANASIAVDGTIYIYNGTYSTAEIDMWKSGVNVTGESKDRVNITGTTLRIFDVHNHYVTFRNLSLFSGGVGPNAACIHADSVAYLTVENCIITNTLGASIYGVHVVDSVACTVQNCDVYNTTFGIYFFGNDGLYNIIDNNNVSNSSGTDYVGIHCQGGESTYIMNNYITGCYFGIDTKSEKNATIYNNEIKDYTYGIGMDMNENNSITYNTISKGLTGIMWCCDRSGSNNNVSYNTIRENDYGIYITNCGMSEFEPSDNYSTQAEYNNVIFGNIFLQNIVHAEIDRNFGCNPTSIVWNISYYQVSGTNYGGGNYWDNYTGVDNFHGVNQDIPGSDNVGDVAHPILQVNLPMGEMGEYFTQGSYQDQYPTFSIGEDTIPLPATNVEATTATLHGWYGWQGINPATCGFYCGINGNCTQSNHDNNFTASGTYTNETFIKGATGLDAGHCHCFNVWAMNVTGFFHPTTTTEYFLTKPSGPPENFSVNNSGATNITLSWDNVTDWVGNDINQTTIIRYSNTSQPATPTEGTLGYWGTAETYTIENLDLDVQYYFSAWTNIRAICNGTYVRYQNSSEFSTITAYTQGGDYNIFVRYENRTYGLVNLSEKFPIYTCDKSDLIMYDEPFSDGDLTDVNMNITTEHLVLNTTVDGNFTLSGYRVSPDYSLSGVADDGGTIAWSEFKPANTDIDIFYNLSTNSGITWDGWVQASNGGSINGISVGTNMEGYLIRFRQNLTTTNNLTTPELISLYINIERTCMWINHSGPHKVIIHYYGHDFDEYYGMVTYIIFENGTAIHDPMPYFDCSNMTNGSFNFSVNRTIKYIEFCWNDTTDCNYRCNRIISPVKGQRNITFYIRTDLPVFTEGTNYMNGSIVKYLYSFVDETGKFRRPNEPRATIYTYNDDEEKMIIHSEYFDDTEAIHPWLVYEKKYFIGVDCLYLTYERIGIAPASENQNPEVRIPYNYQFDYSFYDLINLDVGWFDAGFYVHYHDTTFSTVSATFKVYGYYNHTLMYSDFTTHSGKNFTYTCNTSGNYIWVIETTLDDLDNLYDGTYSSGETPMFSGMEPITDIGTIDDILTIILGRTPLHDADNPDVEVPWTYIMVFALAFIVMTSLGKLNAFVGALGVGFVLTFSGAVITGLQTLFSNYDWWHGPVLILIGVFIIAFGIVGLMGGVED